MTNKLLIFALLVSFILIQCAEPKPMDKANEANTPQETPEDINNFIESSALITPRVRLLAHFVRKTSPIFMPIIESRQIFENVLWKIKNQKDACSYTTPPILSDYVAKINKLLQRDAKQQLALRDNPEFIDSDLGQQLTTDILLRYLESTSDYAAIIEQYVNITPQQTNEFVIKQKLDRNGFALQASYFANAFSHLAPQILLTMENYFATLNQAAYEQEVNLLNWYKHFKQAPNVQTFVKYIEYFSAAEICAVAKYFKNK